MVVEEFKVKKKLNIKLILLLAIALIVVLTFIFLYIFNTSFRNKIYDMIKFTIESENNLTTIYIEQDMVNSAFGYDKYFTILSQNILKGYNESGKEQFSHTINISNSISSSKEKYMVISGENMNRFYLLCGKDILYEKEIAETIKDIYVNKNGYVALSCEQSGYRSIIKLFNPNGEEVFTTFLANTYASNVCISDNNKYLAISEINTSGINLQSSIKIIEISKINTENYIINIDTEDCLISHMSFVSGTELVYLTDKEIKQINMEKNQKTIYKIDSNILNADISLGNYIILAQKNNTSVFNINTDIVIFNKDAKETGRYTVEGNVKQIIAKNNIVCVNIGQKLFFLAMNGRPIKEYNTSMEVKNVIIFDNGNKAGIIYRNKIEIIAI